MTIRILVNGAQGKMGQEVIKMVTAEKDFELVGTTEKDDDLGTIITQSKAQIVIDFTHPSVGFQNTKTILAANARPVIGTTGFTPEQIAELQQIAKDKKIGGIVAPNFSLGGVLMMKYSQDAAKYFPDVEIIELHHDAKADSPSGTAIKTAEMMLAVKKETAAKVVEKTNIPGARGAVQKDIHIHAVRLPGFVASQEVIFGGQGETLKICHSTINREAFMPGVKLACQKIMALHELIYGLENIL